MRTEVREACYESLVLKAAAYWNHLESLKKTNAWVRIPKTVTTGMGQGLGIQIFSSSPGTSNIYGLPIYSNLFYI